MSETIISVEHLSKCYKISHKQERYLALRDVLSNKAKRLFGRGLKTSNSTEDFWALNDISFEIKRGETVGIIGRNGAGKSTLLKLLSRITEPTRGRITLDGRIASLLEVGTGFHPELSGRENIFLNGTILGMSRREIKSKFDEIVDFSGIETFLDTPVKRYSSGMYVRLAFAVAAHLAPDILIVDEVLAVGDVEFQKKCLGKMGEVSKEEGRTVLFVSHQLNAITSLCNSCILLSKGTIKSSGPTNVVVKEYLHVTTDSTSIWLKSNDEYDSKYFSPLKMSVVDTDLNDSSVLSNDQLIGIYMEGTVTAKDPGFCIGFALYDSSNNLLFWSLNTDKGHSEWVEMELGNNKTIGWIQPHFLNEGDYRVELITSIYFKEWICRPEYNAPVVTFSIKGGLSSSPHWTEARPGILAPINNFQKI